MKNGIRTLPAVLISLLAFIVICLTLSYGLFWNHDNAEKITSVTIAMNGEMQKETLPLTLKDLPHGTEVAVSFTLPTVNGDALFFGSVYAPLTIEVNGKAVYEYGMPSTYPSFFKDPPTQYDSILLPPGRNTEIRMIYRSPNERTTLSIHEPYVGSERAILHHLSTSYGLSMLIALFFIMLGMLLIGISLLIMRPNERDAGKVTFVQPGLLFLVCGAWQFGENRLAVYLLQSPSLLYVVDFLGLFTLVIPLYKMAINYLDMKSNRLLNVFLTIQEISAAASIILQLTGIVSFHRLLYFFHILLPASLIVLTTQVLYEYLHNRNMMAGRFFVCFLMLVLAALLELVNYYMHFVAQYSSLFQGGLFLFVIGISVFASVHARDLYAAQLKSLTLENEVKIKEQTIAAQKNRNELLLSHFDEIRRQRHDMRHHLGALDEMIRRGDTDEASAYIRSVTESVPAYTPETFCANTIINATLAFYAQKIRESGIHLDINVQVPEANPNITDANLCVIFGNLLENAFEACRRMPGQVRYIRLNAGVKGEMLFITMDNSYDGNVRADGDRFYSSKRPGFGTGLSSIRTLAESHNGSASFRGMENMFRSEVSVRL